MQVRLALAGEAGTAIDTRGRQDRRRLGADAPDDRKVVPRVRYGGDRRLLDRRGRGLSRLVDRLDLEVGEYVLAAQFLDRRCHELLECSRRLGGQCAPDRERALGRDRLLDESDADRKD